MRLGAFSISLAVKDIKASLAFYQQLGFEQSGGEIEQGWIILKNEAAVIGLFQGMFKQNLLTFTPGLNQSAKALDDFDDVRDIQAALKKAGVEIKAETDPDADGVAHIVVIDPDGNPILIDQHVPRKKG